MSRRAIGCVVKSPKKLYACLPWRHTTGEVWYDSSNDTFKATLQKNSTRISAKQLILSETFKNNHAFQPSINRQVLSSTRHARTLLLYCIFEPLEETFECFPIFRARSKTWCFYVDLFLKEMFLLGAVLGHLVLQIWTWAASFEEEWVEGPRNQCFTCSTLQFSK